MSKAEDQKRLMELEAELAGLLRANEARQSEPDLDPDTALIDTDIPGGKQAISLGITLVKDWVAMTRLLHVAGVVPSSAYPGHKQSKVGEMFDAAAFVQENLNHPLIRRMATLPAQIAGMDFLKLLEELRNAFPCDSVNDLRQRLGLPKRHEGSEIS